MHRAPHDADEILLKISAYVHAKLTRTGRTEGLLDAMTGLYNRQGSHAGRVSGIAGVPGTRPLACVVLALDVEPVEPAAQQQAATSTVCAALKSAGGCRT